MTTTQSQADIPSDRALRGRRLTAEEFRRLTGRDLGADNDNLKIPDSGTPIQLAEPSAKS